MNIYRNGYKDLWSSQLVDVSQTLYLVMNGEIDKQNNKVMGVKATHGMKSLGPNQIYLEMLPNVQLSNERDLRSTLYMGTSFEKSNQHFGGSLIPLDIFNL